MRARRWIILTAGVALGLGVAVIAIIGVLAALILVAITHARGRAQLTAA